MCAYNKKKLYANIIYFHARIRPVAFPSLNSFILLTPPPQKKIQDVIMTLNHFNIVMSKYTLHLKCFIQAFSILYFN